MQFSLNAKDRQFDQRAFSFEFNLEHYHFTYPTFVVEFSVNVQLGLLGLYRRNEN